MKKLILFAGVILFAACNSNQTKENNSSKDTVTVSTATVTPAAEEEKSKVAFKVNDTLARTTMGTANNDRDEQLGLYTEAVKSFSLTLMGDVPARPHRGSLEFTIKDFTFSPGSYAVTKDNYASFRRYETENAGMPTEFSSNHLILIKALLLH